MDIYDNGGNTLDRYTIFLDKNSNACIASDYRGIGFYQHCEAIRGRHLGRRISWVDLSIELKQLLALE